MKNLILSFVIVISVINITFSVSGWFWQNPLPQGNNLSDISWISSNNIYAAGYSGTILKSTDFGITWRFQEPPNVYGYLSLSFLTNNLGYISSSLTVYKTTNGGENWYQTSFPSNEDTTISKIYFINELTGFAVGALYTGLPPMYFIGIVAKTTNGGLSWSFQYDTYTTRMHNIAFINENTGYCCGIGYDGTIFWKTTNSANSWTMLTTESTARKVVFIKIFSASNILYIASTESQGACFESTNSGNNWIRKDLDTVPGNLTSATMIGLESILAVSSEGKIIKSTDRGVHWMIPYAQNSVGFSSVSFIDDFTGMICGSHGELLKTTNSGSNWSSLSSNITLETLSDCFYTSKFTGFILGYDGRILKTTNSGSNWQIITFGPSGYYYGLYFIDSLTGFITGQNGSVYKSTNGGINWSLKNGGVTASLTSITFVNNFTGYAAGTAGKLVKSTSAGEQWYELQSGITYNLTDICFLNTQTGFAVSNHNSIIIQTTDAGVTWVQKNNDPNGNSLRAIDFPSQLKGFAVGENGKILNTTNGGMNWNYQQSNTIHHLRDVSFANEFTGFAVGVGGTMLKTTNSGQIWIIQNCHAYPDLYSIFCIDSLIWIADGQFGTIIKTTNAGNPVGLKSVYNTFPNQFSLSQNYPNPFNPVTKIKFDIPLDSRLRGNDNITLKIYDVLGREAATLVNEKLNPGMYEITWDASAYPSGVYFYKLITQNFSETKKMVLIK